MLFKCKWLLPSHVKDNLAEEGQLKRCIGYIATDLYRNAHNPLSGKIQIQLQNQINMQIQMQTQIHCKIEMHTTISLWYQKCQVTKPGIKICLVIQVNWQKTWYFFVSLCLPGSTNKTYVAELTYQLKLFIVTVCLKWSVGQIYGRKTQIQFPQKGNIVHYVYLRM